MATLQLHSATKSFGKLKVIEEIAFSLSTGEILGVFGRNGSGKSTLLKMLFGTVKADSISVSIDNVPIRSSEIISKKLIGYLPQNSMLPKNLKVRDIIPIYFSDGEKQDAIFYDSQIAKITANQVGELSAGELRYFEVLLIGNLDHPFLMFDEPFSMIEPLYKIEIKRFLKELKSKKGILITDHYYHDVLDITTKNLIIKGGKGFSITNMEDLKNHNYLSKNSS
ncbi:ATP-binding cassette domain-containing protein [Aequorivita capsosiphonis]|uniref:ATP-binding cassette domain-containing protein n=1 Tax=Aequorivita capsosiphonis TaxID=487317 RepID=UPI00047E9636|nr:ATP-binding cassette domain-containing protein [Aequorivita capsosiphonis]